MPRIGIWAGLFALLAIWSAFGAWRAFGQAEPQLAAWLLFNLFVLVLLCLIATALFQQARIDFWEAQYTRHDPNISFEQMYSVYLDADFSMARTFAQLFAGLCVVAGFYLTFVNPQNPTDLRFAFANAQGSATADIPALALLLVSLVLMTMLSFARRDRGPDGRGL